MHADRLKMLLLMARTGLSARAERMPPQEICEAGAALTEGEAWVVVLTEQAKQAERKEA